VSHGKLAQAGSTLTTTVVSVESPMSSSNVGLRLVPMLSPLPFHLYLHPSINPAYPMASTRLPHRQAQPPRLLLSARFLLPPPSLPLDLPATTVQCEDANCTSQVICSVKPVVTPFVTPASPLVPSPPHHHTYILNCTIHHHFILINTPTTLRPVPFAR
jgi:hypothetical protein